MPGSPWSSNDPRRWGFYSSLLLTVAVLNISLGCTTQPPGVSRSSPMYRLGYLTSAGPDAPSAVDGFQKVQQRLQELGYREGENLTLEYRFTGGNDAQFPVLAAELVQLPVDLIIVGDSRGIPVAKAATSTIPIVMVVSGDVVGLGLVDSLARPGGNLTGLTDLSRTLNTKRLQLLVQSVPGASRVAVLWNGGHPGIVLAWDEVEAAARVLGVDLISLNVQSPDSLESAFAAATSQGADALLVLPDPLTNVNAQQIVALAAQHGLPAMYGTKVFMDLRGLMYYGPSRATMSRRAAEYVDKILKGTKPMDLPIEQPTTFDFIVNFETARALKLAMPDLVLGSVTETRQ